MSAYGRLMDAMSEFVLWAENVRPCESFQIESSGYLITAFRQKCDGRWEKIECLELELRNE